MKQTATAEDYARVFEKERQNVYPVVDAFEQRMGYAIDRAKLEEAARVLACPVKRNPPSWQHGRVLYAAVRRYFSVLGWHLDDADSANILEIGTAKSFGALCLQWALNDSGVSGVVTSVDVIDPNELLPSDGGRRRRNTVAELGLQKTLRDILKPWPETKHIHFECCPGIDWLLAHDDRIHVAFVDGKHTGPVVAKEGWLLSQRQVSGDLAIFDDVHLPDIAKAVDGLHEYYTFERIDVLPTRAYAVGVRK